MTSHSQSLTRKRKAETDPEQLRAEVAQERVLQLDDLEGGGEPILRILEFLDGVALIDFADTHPRPHQLVFESPINYWEKLQLNVPGSLEILEKLFSKQNRGMQFRETIDGTMARLSRLVANNPEEDAALLPRVKMFVENLEWCSGHVEFDQQNWVARLASLTVGFLAVISDHRLYRSVWESFHHLSGIQLLTTLMHEYWDDPTFPEIGLRVLSRLAFSREASQEAILESNILGMIQTCLKRWHRHYCLKSQVLRLLYHLMRPISRDSRESHGLIEDRVREQVLENGLMPYIISFINSTTVMFSEDIRQALSLLVKLCNDQSQHFTQIKQSFLSSGGEDALDELIRRLAGGEDQQSARQLRELVAKIRRRIRAQQG